MGSHGWVDGSMDFWMGFETGMGSVGRRSSREGVRFDAYSGFTYRVI